MNQPLDIRPDHLWMVKSILREYLPQDVKVFAFGSRAKWTTKSSSDLDICLKGEEALPDKVLSKIEIDLEETVIPYKVDVIDWNRITPEFQKNIEDDLAEISIYRHPFRLGDITDLNWGDTKTTKKSYTDDGYPAYSAKGQDGFLPYHDFDRTGVVISAIGANCGQTWLAKDKWSCIKNTLRFWSVSPDADTEYLFFLTSSRDFWPKRGSAQPFISQGDARSLVVNLPPIDEQKAVVGLLSSIENKISLNQRMNETLEAMAREVFKDWFIDFGPTRAKAEGREPYLPPALWALFPNTLDDESKPEGWNKQPLGAFCEVAIGGLWGEDNAKGEEYIQYKCLRGVDLQHLRETGDAAQAPERFAKKSAIEKRMIRDADVLIASSGIGPCGRSLWTSVKDFSSGKHPTIYSNFVKRLKCQSSAHACFIDQHLYEMNLNGEMQKYISGTSVPNLKDASLLEAHMITAPAELVLEAFLEFSSMLQKHLFSGESITLAQTRDTLLPKLISGEIRIADAEKAAEGAA